MDRISNSKMHEYTTDYKAFRNNNDTVYAKYEHHVGQDNDLYVVYSYGVHFPMYIYDTSIEQWFGNGDKYSPTTGRHKSLAKPDVGNMTMLPTEEMSRLIRLGGYIPYCADRCTAPVLHYKVDASTFSMGS